MAPILFTLCGRNSLRLTLALPPALPSALPPATAYRVPEHWRALFQPDGGILAPERIVQVGMDANLFVQHTVVLDSTHVCICLLHGTSECRHV